MCTANSFPQQHVYKCHPQIWLRTPITLSDGWHFIIQQHQQISWIGFTKVSLPTGLQNSQQPNALEMRPSGWDQSLKSELFFFWNENKNIRDKYIILIQTQDWRWPKEEILSQMCKVNTPTLNFWKNVFFFSNIIRNRRNTDVFIKLTEQL